MVLYRLVLTAAVLSVGLCCTESVWQQLCSQAAQMHAICQGPTGQSQQTVNVTTGTSNGAEQRREVNEAKLYFFSSTMTWSSGKTFCQSRKKRMCYSRELCQPNGNGQAFRYDVLNGDNWVPVLDQENEWLEAGSSDGRTCFVHSEHYGKPTWGTSQKAAQYKGYVYCCEDDPDTGIVDSGMRFQSLGKAATYATLQQHCEDQNMRLCSASEVCRGTSPYFGVIRGDHWTPVNDRTNEWVEIGNDLGRTCWVHGPHYGPPDWGIRTDGSLVDHVGYVICCPL